MTGTSLIFGLHAVEAALKRDPSAIQQLWCDVKRKDKRLKTLSQLAGNQGVRPDWVTRSELDAMLPEGVRHQGVVARVQGSVERSESFLEQLLVDLQHPPLLLVLDGVTDPHNLGACLRSADAAGVDAVITTRDKACGLTPVVRKVASGAAESVPFVQVTNLARTLNMLKGAGVWVIGTALEEGAAPLFETNLEGPLALVLGAEGKGLRRLTRESCDQLIHIPMYGSVESLNVSVATGICLFEAVRQRRLGNTTG
ncbi:MAG: 23S rRNA (guanosine(2251)-2'-O)-methyltransferase RlmB [Pseudomonadota bacterium]